jgi:hypothetical protein
VRFGVLMKSKLNVPIELARVVSPSHLPKDESDDGLNLALKLLDATDCKVTSTNDFVCRDNNDNYHYYHEFNLMSEIHQASMRFAMPMVLLSPASPKHKSYDPFPFIESVGELGLYSAEQTESITLVHTKQRGDEGIKMPPSDNLRVFATRLAVAHYKLA